MTIQSKGKCKQCKTNPKPNNDWKEIGDQVKINEISGNTRHIFYQCKTCGSILINILDEGGPSGKGSFYYSLTEKYY